LGISKEIINTGDAPYDSGDVIQYRITVTNTGDGDATGVIITDSYETSYASFSGMNNGNSPDTTTG